MGEKGSWGLEEGMEYGVPGPSSVLAVLVWKQGGQLDLVLYAEESQVSGVGWRRWPAQESACEHEKSGWRHSFDSQSVSLKRLSKPTGKKTGLTILVPKTCTHFRLLYSKKKKKKSFKAVYLVVKANVTTFSDNITKSCRYVIIPTVPSAKAPVGSRGHSKGALLDVE